MPQLPKERVGKIVPTNKADRAFELRNTASDAHHGPDISGSEEEPGGSALPGLELSASTVGRKEQVTRDILRTRRQRSQDRSVAVEVVDPMNDPESRQAANRSPWAIAN